MYAGEKEMFFLIFKNLAIGNHFYWFYKPHPIWKSLNCPVIGKCKRAQVLSSKNDLGSVEQQLASLTCSRLEFIGRKVNKYQRVPILSAWPSWVHHGLFL